MKKVKLVLAVLAMTVGSVTSFAFRTKTLDTPCKTGSLAQFKSQCALITTPVCCETANGHKYNGPLIN